jgi:hypothetical protein
MVAITRHDLRYIYGLQLQQDGNIRPSHTQPAARSTLFSYLDLDFLLLRKICYVGS